MKRGDIWWADLPAPSASEPAYTRPVLIVQADSFNRSRINTVLALSISSNLNLAHAAGNVEISSRKSGLSKNSVINISQLMTINKHLLRDFVKSVDGPTLLHVEEGLKTILGLH